MMKDDKRVFVLLNEPRDFTHLKPDASVEGVIVGPSAWITLGLAGAAQMLREKAEGRRVILNSGFTFEGDNERNEVAKKLKSTITKVDGITISGLLWRSPTIIKDMMAFGGKVYYNVLGDPAFFNPGAQALFVQRARRCKCKGVIMTAKQPREIIAARRAVGRSFEILVHIEDDNEVGDGIKAGASIEIIEFRRWNKLIDSDLN